MSEEKLVEGHPVGTAVIVAGQVVAWFREFSDMDADWKADYYQSIQDWCRDNYFGQWLTWRAEPPKILPLTEEEEAEVQKKVAEFDKFFNGSNCD